METIFTQLCVTNQRLYHREHSYSGWCFSSVRFDGVSNIFVSSVGTAVAQWLRCCATNRKVAGSIPDGVIGIFH